MNRPTILPASVFFLLLISGCSDATCPRNLGAGTISSLTLAAAINPAQHPTVSPDPIVASLVCITYGDLESGGSSFEQCINYTFKGTIDGVSNYTGLYLRSYVIGGAAIELIEPLYDSAAPTQPLNLSPNVWNALSISAGDGGMPIVVNGKTAAVRLAAPRDTIASVSIGAGDWNVSYDNVVVAIGR